MSKALKQQTDGKQYLDPGLPFSCDLWRWHRWLVSDLLTSTALQPLGTPVHDAPSIKDLAWASLSFYALNDLSDACRYLTRGALMLWISWGEMPDGDHPTWVSGGFGWDDNVFRRLWPPTLVEIRYRANRPTYMGSLWTADFEAARRIGRSFFNVIRIP